MGGYERKEMFAITYSIIDTIESPVILSFLRQAFQNYDVIIIKRLFLK